MVYFLLLCVDIHKYLETMVKCCQAIRHGLGLKAGTKVDHVAI